MSGARSENTKTNDAKAQIFGQKLYEEMVAGGESKTDAKILADRATTAVTKLASLQPKVS